MVTLEPFQELAVKFLCENVRALIKSPAGSGKTIIAAAAVDRVLHAKQRVKKVRLGWIANTIDQCDQARRAVAMFPAIAELCEIFIACPAGVPEDYECDVMVIDEAHHATAATWAEVIGRQKGALWFLTATPFGEDRERNQRLREMSGNNIFIVPREAVKSRVVHGVVNMLDATDKFFSDTGISVRQYIDDAIDQDLQAMVRRVLYMKRWEYWAAIETDFCHANGIPIAGSTKDTWERVTAVGKEKEAGKAILEACSKELWPRVAYGKCLELGIARNFARNAAIIDLCRRHEKDSVLILVNSIGHGELLADSLKAVVCHSRMGIKRRRQTLAEFAGGGLRTIIATSLADEGLDVPRANVLILAGAGKSAREVEQRTGRVLRAFEDKQRGTIYDFEDLQHPLLASQSRKRQRYYHELGYTVQPWTPNQIGLFSAIP